MLYIIVPGSLSRSSTLARLANVANMASICAVDTFYRNAEVIERFRSRISFKDGLIF